ncbi:MAG: SDR family NAD(P)-dependent oxidoreductase, partial [Pseudomonadota bacterium]
ALAARLAGRPIDALVANAGVLTTYGGFGEAGHREAGWRETLMVNVYGPFALAEALVENAAAGAGKKIAIVSSVMGSSARATGGAYAYRASKAAAVNLARNLATDLRPRGIAVGAYHPGWVRTEMGGPNADIAVEESAAGLLARIDALTLARTGVFEDHQGAPVPF